MPSYQEPDRPGPQYPSQGRPTGQFRWATGREQRRRRKKDLEVPVRSKAAWKHFSLFVTKSDYSASPSHLFLYFK